MAIQYQKELAQLKTSAETDLTGIIPFSRFFWWGALFLIFSSLIASTPRDEKDNLLHWSAAVDYQVQQRSEFLEGLPILGAALSSFYYSVSSQVVSVLISKENYEAEPGEVGWSRIDSWLKLTARWLADSLIFLLFLAIVCIPFWVVFSLVGFFYTRSSLRSSYDFDILGICDRKVSPFYSGIHATLKDNGGPSGIELSVPGLACPPMCSEEESKSLASYQLVERNLSDSSIRQVLNDLLRIIGASRDYPGYIPPETPSDDDFMVRGVANNPSDEEISAEEPLPSSLFTVEQSARRGVSAVIGAYEFLRRVVAPACSPAGEIKDQEYYKLLAEHEARMSDLERVLVHALTPQRACALLQIPLHSCVLSLLALEAGKSLLFKKQDGAFVQISRYPHIQARAVLNSLKTFHQLVLADERFVIRRAVLCSRRHGDFGRALIPLGTPSSIRALRDWLEVSQSGEGEEFKSGTLVRFDAEMEEIALSFTSALKEIIAQAVKAARESTSLSLAGAQPVPRAVIGFSHGGVILFPLHKLLELSLGAVSQERFALIKQLMDEIRSHKLQPPVTTRLPGLSKQWEQIKKEMPLDNGSSSLLSKQENGSDLLLRWSMVRQALVRSNWLSTRIGDDAVPDDGLVQAIVYQVNRLGHSDGDASKQQIAGAFSALVPLRRRRFRELSGDVGMQLLYSGLPENEAIGVFRDAAEFSRNLDLG